MSTSDIVGIIGAVAAIVAAMIPIIYEIRKNRQNSKGKSYSELKLSNKNNNDQSFVSNKENDSAIKEASSDSDSLVEKMLLEIITKIDENGRLDDAAKESTWLKIDEKDLWAKKDRIRTYISKNGKKFLSILIKQYRIQNRT